MWISRHRVGSASVGRTEGFTEVAASRYPPDLFMALPSVFLSYPRAAPDRGSKIARLRDTLTAEIQVLTGEQTFEIFDSSSLGLGENSRRVQQELAQASFLLPIGQPLLFTSAEA